MVVLPVRVGDGRARRRPVRCVSGTGPGVALVVVGGVTVGGVS